MSTTTFNQFQYDDLAAKSQDVYALTKWKILEGYLAGHQDLRVLNVGCGSGELCLQLAALGHRVTGIDPEQSYIDLSLGNAARSPFANRCSFEVAFAETYRPKEPFDCVVATDVLEHIEDDRTAFNSMMDVVRPGGLVLVTVPAGQWLFGYHDEQLGHFRRYSKKTLRQLVEGRCRVEAMRYFGFTLIPVCYLYSKKWRKPYPVAESSDTSKRPFRAWVLRTLMKMDRILPMPLGTSLLMKGVKTN